MTLTVTDDQRQRHRFVAIVVALVALVAVAVPIGLWWVASQSSASFADSEILDANHLGAGTLDVEVGEEIASFEAANLAPGDAVSGHLEVSNAGSLPLRFSVTGRTDGGLLGRWLRFELWVPTSECGPNGAGSRLTSDVLLTTRPTELASPDASPLLSLPPGETVLLCVGAVLPLDASNEVQGQRLAVEVTVDAVHDIEAES